MPLSESDLELAERIHPELTIIVGGALYNPGYPQSDLEFERALQTLRWSTINYDDSCLDDMRSVASFCLACLVRAYDEKHKK